MRISGEGKLIPELEKGSSHGLKSCLRFFQAASYVPSAGSLPEITAY